MMAQIKPLRTSIFPKLLDDEPNKMREMRLSTQEEIQRIKDQVKVDLTELLNTRKSMIKWDEDEVSELNDSLLNYGVQDFMQYRLNAKQDTERLCQSIIEAIEKFEPRLTKVEVEPVETKEVNSGGLSSLHFRIHAELFIEPIEESVMFESVLRVKTGDISVR